MGEISQHFVTFYSPGTFTTKPIDAWDVDAAVSMARAIQERHGATPYGFRFSTRTRGPDDHDSHVSARSGLYWLGGTVKTLAELDAEADPGMRSARQNMRINGWDKLVINDNSWRWTGALADGDVVLDFAPAPKPADPEHHQPDRSLLA